jgi:hypothetical protein
VLRKRKDGSTSRSWRFLYAGVALLVLHPIAASAQESCRRAIVFTLPGVTWEDVDAVRPPELLRIVEEGAAGSISVRTIASRTSYASGYATLGAGARVDAPQITGAPVDTGSSDGILDRDVQMNIAPATELAKSAGYDAVPGALGSAVTHPLVAIGNADLGRPVPTPVGPSRWALVAAMERTGAVAVSVAGSELLTDDPDAPYGVRTDPAAIRAAVDAALAIPCASLIIDHGDLARADHFADLMFDERPRDRSAALSAADQLLGYVRGKLDLERDLLLVVSPTSPAWESVARLGVAVAAGPGFEAGATVESASTRRRGVVTLPDVAPTVLDHLGDDRPPSMNGRPWLGVEAPEPDRIAAAIDLDDESVFVDGIKGPVSTWFVVGQVVVYLLALALLAWRESRARRREDPSGPGVSGLARWLERAALALVAFPISTFFMGAVKAHELGTLPFVAILLAIDALLVVAASLIAGRPLDRLLVLCALTLAVVAADLVTGGRLQLNTVFGYSPIVAGRFAGAGNIAFAVLGASTVLTGALIVHRWRNPRAIRVTAILFAVVVIIDGAPPFGSDVGGVLALVPALAITVVLLSGRRPSLKVLAIGLAGALVSLAAFVAIDLARPPSSRTHLGRLFEDVQARGVNVLTDTVERKLSSNLKVFRSTIWTFFVPPALAAMAWFLARPRGRWGRLAVVFPKLRAGLVGGLIVAVLGFAVNDSGIVIPAVVLSFLVPMALLVHLVLEMEEELPASPEPAMGEPERVR